MNPLWKILIRAAVILPSAAALAVRYRKSLSASGKADREIWQPLIAPMTLASVCLSMLAVFFLFGLLEGRDTYCFELDIIVAALTFCVSWYSLLAAAMPRLRRRYAPRVCALLWLLPGAVNVSTFYLNSEFLERPLLVIPPALPPGVYHLDMARRNACRAGVSMDRPFPLSRPPYALRPSGVGACARYMEAGAGGSAGQTRDRPEAFAAVRFVGGPDACERGAPEEDDARDPAG